MRTLATFLVVGMFSGGALTCAEEKAEELSGTWKNEKPGGASFGLRDLKSELGPEYVHFVSVAAQGKELEFKGGKLHASVPKGKDLDLTVTLQSDTKPHRIVATNADKKIVFHGIWQIDDGRLILCFTMGSMPIPSEFKNAPPESRLMRLVRVKK